MLKAAVELCTCSNCGTEWIENFGSNPLGQFPASLACRKCAELMKVEEPSFQAEFRRAGTNLIVKLLRVRDQAKLHGIVSQDATIDVLELQQLLVVPDWQDEEERKLNAIAVLAICFNRIPDTN